MQDVVLKAKTRNEVGKAVAKLRSEGFVPGVVYGQGSEAVNIAVPRSDLEDVYMTAGTNRLVQLTIDEKKTPLNTLFVDMQEDPVSTEPLHFDLYTVKMDEEIDTEIPIHFEGAAPAAYDKDGILVKNLETIEVRALPNKLPESFTVDLEQLEDINDAVHVSDLDIPEGVEVLIESEELIVKVDPPRSEEELEELDEAIDEDAEEQVASEHGAEEDEGESSTETDEEAAPAEEN